MGAIDLEGRSRNPSSQRHLSVPLWIFHLEFPDKRVYKCLQWVLGLCWRFLPRRRRNDPNLIPELPQLSPLHTRNTLRHRASQIPSPLISGNQDSQINRLFCLMQRLTPWPCGRLPSIGKIWRLKRMTLQNGKCLGTLVVVVQKSCVRVCVMRTPNVLGGKNL